MFPSSVVTVIIALPAARAVITPLFTVATEVFEVLHVTFLLVAFNGAIVAVSCSSLPVVIVMLLRFKVTSVTLTGSTVTVHEALSPFDAVAVTTTLPLLPYFLQLRLNRLKVVTHVTNNVPSELKASLALNM